MENIVIIIFNMPSRNISVDIEVSLDITARDLVIGLNKAFDLKIDVHDIKQCYLKVENPIMLLRGNKVLYESGLRNGSIVTFVD